MKIILVGTGIALAVSLLFNVVLMGRLHDEEEMRTTLQTAPRPSRSESPIETGARPYAAPDPLPTIREAPLVIPAASPSKAAAQGTAAPSVIRSDPKVQEVLDAQDSFSAFWKELDRVVKARSRFDEAKYVQTVLASTMEFLELGPSARTPFSQSAQAAASAAAMARKDYDAGRQALPPKDKANPATYAVYKQQKDAVDARYQAAMKSAVDGLKAHLDPARPRPAEFASNSERWIRNLAPRLTQP